MTFLLTCTPQNNAGQRLSDIFADWAAHDYPAALFEESPSGEWVLKVFFERHPSDQEILDYAASHGETLPPFTVNRLEERDWIADSLAGLHPIAAGRFYVHGSHDEPRYRGDRGSILIDAGQAFGTGHHGTTATCLEALDLCLKQYPYRRIIDVGCGTGVLAIAAARATGALVMATDIDPVATEITRQNAALNSVGPQIRTLTADGLADPRILSAGPYDLIIANILANPLIGLAEQIRQAAARPATLILSGIMKHQAKAVIARYRAAGFLLSQMLAEQEWRTIILQRPAGPGKY